jgi:hypothetical protein
LIARLQEAAGLPAAARLKAGGMEAELNFRPFEIKTLRLDRSGPWREVDLIEES